MQASFQFEAILNYSVRRLIRGELVVAINKGNGSLYLLHQVFGRLPGYNRDGFSKGMPASRLFAAALAISALATQLANLSVSPAIAEVAIALASNKAAIATAGLFAARLLRRLSS
jgi:hypothetical protein